MKHYKTILIIIIFSTSSLCHPPLLQASVCMVKAEDAQALANSTHLSIREQQITASVAKVPCGTSMHVMCNAFCINNRLMYTVRNTKYMFSVNTFCYCFRNLKRGCLLMPITGLSQLSSSEAFSSLTRYAAYSLCQFKPALAVINY